MPLLLCNSSTYERRTRPFGSAVFLADVARRHLRGARQCRHRDRPDIADAGGIARYALMRSAADSARIWLPGRPLSTPALPASRYRSTHDQSSTGARRRNAAISFEGCFARLSVCAANVFFFGNIDFWFSVGQFLADTLMGTGSAFDGCRDSWSEHFDRIVSIENLAFSDTGR